MSSNLSYKQASNVERRTWDRDEYEKKARARANEEPKAGDKRPLPANDEEEKEEFRPAVEGAAGPEKSKRAFLKARRDKVDIDSKVGSTEIVSVEAVAKTSTTGSVTVRLYIVTIHLYSSFGKYEFSLHVDMLRYCFFLVLLITDSGWNHKDRCRLALQSLRLFSQRFAYLS